MKQEDAGAKSNFYPAAITVVGVGLWLATATSLFF